MLMSFEERSGEAWWTAVQLDPDWETLELPVRTFQRDQEKPRRNGRFDPADVVRVTLADARGLEGARGSQTIWLRDWVAR